METRVCWMAVLLSFLASMAVAYNCYRCADYDELHVEVQGSPEATEKLRNEIKSLTRPACRLRNSTSGISLTGCEEEGDFQAGCASGDILTTVNFTYPVKFKEVPATARFRLRFRTCYARRPNEEEGCRDVEHHQDILLQQGMLFVRRDKPLKEQSALAGFKMQLCWIAVLYVFITTVVADRFNCYQCEDFDDLHVEVKDNPKATEHLRKEILDFKSRQDCRHRNIETSDLLPAGCEDAGHYYASCASGDVIAAANFTYPVRDREVPATARFRLRFRSCYARRPTEEEGCGEVKEHQDLLMQQVRVLVRKNKPLKISSFWGEVCLCEGHGCNANLPEREPESAASIPALPGATMIIVLTLSALAGEYYRLPSIK